MQSFPILTGWSCTIGNVVTMPNSKLHLLPGFQFEKLHLSWYLCLPMKVGSSTKFFFLWRKFLSSVLSFTSLHSVIVRTIKCFASLQNAKYKNMTIQRILFNEHILTKEYNVQHKECPSSWWEQNKFIYIRENLINVQLKWCNVAKQSRVVTAM